MTSIYKTFFVFDENTFAEYIWSAIILVIFSIIELITYRMFLELVCLLFFLYKIIQVLKSKVC